MENKVWFSMSWERTEQTLGTDLHRKWCLDKCRCPIVLTFTGSRVSTNADAPSEALAEAIAFSTVSFSGHASIDVKNATNSADTSFGGTVADAIADASMEGATVIAAAAAEGTTIIAAAMDGGDTAVIAVE